MANIDPWFWRHAYMLEFRETDENGASLSTEDFTFSLPPESEQITLSGTTGNSELKTIFRGNTKFPTLLSGEDEILYIARLIEKYGKIDNLTNKSIYLFDLSKINSKILVTSPNYWQVNIDSFRYQRDKATPTYYKYTLEMTAYRPKKTFLFDLQGEFGNNIVLKGINITIDVIQGIFATSAAIVDACTILVEDTAELQSVYDNYKNLVTGKISQVVNTWNELVSLGKWIKNKFGTSSSTSTTTTDSESSEDGETQDQNDTNEDFQNALDTLKTDFESFKTKVENELSNMSDEIAQTIINQQGLTSRDEFESLVACMLDEMQNQIDELAAKVKQLAKVAYYKGTIYYGKKEIIANSTDTYESISLKEYGTIDYADDIATFNNGAEISTGTTIVVPILTETESIAGNEVVKPADDLDEYGKDIALDEDGDISINYSNGDIKQIESEENIEQAIVSRISTEMGTRIRDTVYGIKSNIGGNSAVTAFLYASIHETVLSDPRIDEVDSIEFEGNGDKLFYTINYITKIGDKNTIRGNV